MQMSFIELKSIESAFKVRVKVKVKVKIRMIT